MDNLALKLGEFVMVFGGILFAACIFLLLGYLICIAWTAFSVTFRAICKAESLILEYRKNREKFLEWKAGVEDGN